MRERERVERYERDERELNGNSPTAKYGYSLMNYLMHLICYLARVVLRERDGREFLNSSAHQSEDFLPVLVRLASVSR